MFRQYCVAKFKKDGWTLVGDDLQRHPRSVVIAAPHTSNWDMVYSLAAFELLKLPLRFTIKKEWLRFPFRSIMEDVGAIAIDRSPRQPGEKRASAVEAMARLFEENPGPLALMITPEGTRSLRTRWKSGFYHVAMSAEVPILLGYLDYAKREAGVGRIVHPTGDFDADMRIISEFYRNVQGRHPENFSLDERYIQPADAE